MHRLHQPWVLSLTWSILGALVATSVYDLLRTVLPICWLRRTWVQERRLFKMMGADIAIASAFAGTVFQRYMPWLAAVPSLFGPSHSFTQLLLPALADKVLGAIVLLRFTMSRTHVPNSPMQKA